MNLGKAREALTTIARDPRHSDREAAFARIVELARAGVGYTARRHGIYALGEVGDRRGEDALREALTDPLLADSKDFIHSALGKLR